MKHVKNWEVEINRPQRAEARKLALDKYPDITEYHVWGEGEYNEHTVREWKHHPSYAGEYLKQLRKIRAKRFN